MTDGTLEHGVRVRAERGLAIVTPLGEVDARTAQHFWEALASVSRDHSLIVADLTAQQDCDWHAMSALLMALRYTDAGGGELRVAAASPHVRAVLATAGVDRLVAVFSSLAEAFPDSDPPFGAGLPGVAPV